MTVPISREMGASLVEVGLPKFLDLDTLNCGGVGPYYRDAQSAELGDSLACLQRNGFGGFSTGDCT